MDKRRSTTQGHGLALVVIATAQLMVMLDLTIVNIALPSMQKDLHFSAANLAWVIDAYVLVFGGLLLLGGKAGDLFGRRRMFITGVGLFTVASFAGGLATTQSWLIAARSVQGIGAAIASPTALSLIAVTFAEGAPRNRAMAVYAGMSGAGGALGLLIGGILVNLASWRWVLFVNVPIGATVLLIAPWVLPKTAGRRGWIDIPGALTVSGGMALLVYGLIRAARDSWSNTGTIIAFVAAAVLLGIFVLVEAKSKQPLLALRFLKNRNRAGSYAVMLLLGASMLSLLFFLTQFLQDILHYSPLETGIAYLPLPVVVGLTGLIVSRQIRRFGVKPFLIAGPLMVAGGLLWVSSVTSSSSYFTIFAPLVVVGIGMGLSFVPLTLSAITGIGSHETGLASALLNASQQIGGSLGLAALVTVAATATRDQMHNGMNTLHAAIGTGSAAKAADALHRLATGAAVHGYQSAFRGGAIGALAAFLVTLIVIRAHPSATAHRLSVTAHREVSKIEQATIDNADNADSLVPNLKGSICPVGSLLDSN
ncbi:MAG: MFS transporter [Actinobacteria bacterium]|nr:MFS transporter [Actinomycetota bacterium]